ncbi:hypothetical protein C8R41DRAFT_760050, partial [Lentinula lateritia]
TCVLDILRHIPRCSFSRKQNLAIHWAMLALGVPNLPSDRTMDDIDKELQKLCGIKSIHYEGAFNHIYYVNDLSAIISQEMHNPSIRPHLRFLPEDSGKELGEAYQGQRWLTEQDPDLLTPMHSVLGQNFFTLEPTLLHDKCVCMPSRWFTRSGRVYAKAWPMKVVELDDGASGWAVQTHLEIEVAESDLLLSFPEFKRLHLSLKAMDPSKIIGMQSDEDIPAEYAKWTRTNPSFGNKWRTKSNGKQVLAFPIWLYCDDTLGNVSKKWNKHNSFLFTPAGLPRCLAQKEKNVHFLCTSNIAQPLEMLDGIADQIEKGQTEGIWAWDSQRKDIVLLIPSVHALLGDNPMQSEFSCHIGFMGRLFCRICWASKSESSDGDESREACGYDSDASNCSSTSQKAKPKRTLESMSDMIIRVQNFMKHGTPRTRVETLKQLRSQFMEASRIGGGAEFKRMKTASGIKDTFQEVFAARIQAIATNRKMSKDEREHAIIKLKHSFPQHTTSPVWQFKGLNPHQDTPVEVLHVCLLGVVKYFWRDAVARTKKDHDVLIARLASFDTTGLGISPLAGRTLVTYAGSLTGRDFRAVVQAAPFVLHGLITDDQLELWKSLSALCTLIWQPKINDIDQYLEELKKTIDHFLDCSCRLTPRWFNKPKFHVLLHLPDHIRRFGPAMLFATEAFESYNAIIRAKSVHSNRHAPSKDIAHSMAQGNRLCHLLDGGLFWFKPPSTNGEPTSAASSRRQNSTTVKVTTKTHLSIYERFSENPSEFSQPEYWISASNEARSLLKILNIDIKLLGHINEGEEEDKVYGTIYGEPVVGTSSFVIHVYNLHKPLS